MPVNEFAVCNACRVAANLQDTQEWKFPSEILTSVSTAASSADALSPSQAVAAIRQRFRSEQVAA